MSKQQNKKLVIDPRRVQQVSVQSVEQNLRADLAVESAWVRGNVTDRMAGFPLGVRVVNRGNAPVASAYIIRASLPGFPAREFNANHIPANPIRPGQSFAYEFYFFLGETDRLPPGQYDIAVMIDSSDVISELNENNNQGVALFAVQSAV
ncbi:MAG: CARDB domain-containing protein [Candidatus Omnitrophota bacterium]